MRVLDPQTRNPFYKMVHKINSAFGNVGTILATGAVTMGGPAVAGVVSTPTLFFAAASAVPAYFTIAKYKGNVKENARLDTVYGLRKKIHEDYYPEVDAVISDIFSCDNTHKKYESTYGESLNSYLSKVERDRFGYNMSGKTRKEYTEKWEAGKETDKVLALGSSCEYCGKRIAAIAQLVQASTTESTREIDDARLNNLIEVISAKTLGEKALSEFINSDDVMSEIRNSVRKELTSGK